MWYIIYRVKKEIDPQPKARKHPEIQGRAEGGRERETGPSLSRSGGAATRRCLAHKSALTDSRPQYGGKRAGTNGGQAEAAHERGARAN